jgi:hypothetical protein
MALVLNGTDGTVGTPAVTGSTGGAGTGVYYPATNQVALATNGTQAVLVDANQNVGVGVTPSAWGLGTNGHALEFSNAGSMWNYSNTTGINLSQNVYYNGAYYYKSTAAATLYGQGSGQHLWYTAPSGTAGNAITFTQAMTLDVNGNLLVGTTTSAGRLTVKGTTTDNSTTGITVQDSSANSLFYVRNDGLVNTGISTNSPYNATTASSANLLVTSSGSLSRATSALKYKQDVRNLENVDISIFRPVRYKSKCYLDNSTNDYIGFIADEYVDHYPELVSFGSEGQVEGFAYERMTAILCKAIQELSAQVTTLQTQVTALQTKVSA